MSEALNRHPSPAEFLEYLGGELPSAGETEIRAHLETCVDCCETLEETESGWNAWLNLHLRMKTSIPDPPRPWRPLPHPVRRLWWRPLQWAAVAAALVAGWFSIRQIQRPPAVSAAELLKKAAVVEAREGRPVAEVDWSGRTALVLGGEATGPGEPARALAAGSVHIPMTGKAESLNAAVAGGILLYEIAKKRESTKDTKSAK